MKKIINMLLFLLFSAGISFAQEKNAGIPRQILTTVEQMPSFPGGTDVLKQFLIKNLRYPKNAYQKNIQGKVIVRFIVEPDGIISSPEIISSLDADCDKETMRVIHKMPRWHPGRQNGAFVATYYTLPVTFSLQ